jgi:hypothetical protein
MEPKKRRALGDLTQAVMDLADAWGLQTREIQEMLALPDKVRARSFQQFREGRAVFPDDPEVLRRANYLLRISESLRTSFPRNPEMGGRWIRQPHRRFGRRSPLSIILGSGESGFIAVLSEVDCTFSWDLTGSKAVSYRKA